MNWMSSTHNSYLEALTPNATEFVEKACEEVIKLNEVMQVVPL